MDLMHLSLFSFTTTKHLFLLFEKIRSITFLAFGGLILDFLLIPLDTGLAFSGLFFFMDPILGVILLEDFFKAGLDATSGVLGVFLADTGDILVFFVAVFGVTASLGLCLGDVLVIAATIILAADLGESFFDEAEADALIALTIGVFLADFGVTAADFGVPVLDSGVPYLEPGVAALEAGVAVLMPGVACLGVAGLLLGVSTFLFLLGVGVFAVMAIAGIVPKKTNHNYLGILILNML